MDDTKPVVKATDMTDEMQEKVIDLACQLIDIWHELRSELLEIFVIVSLLLRLIWIKFANRQGSI